jgi:hypothetical protein
LESTEELSRSTFHTYLYMVRASKPVGPRDLMRGAHLSSPSVAYRNLQKLIDQGLVAKDEYGNYLVKKKIRLKGYLWFGKTLVPTFAVWGFIFVAFLGAELAVLTPHLVVGASIEESFWMLTAMTIGCAIIFLYEGLRFRKKPIPI